MRLPRSVRSLGVAALLAASPTASAAAQTPAEAGAPLGAPRLTVAASGLPSHCASAATRRNARIAAAATGAAANAALYVYFREQWWSGEKADRFVLNWDWNEEFRDQDKLGHALGGFHLARLGTSMLRGACVPPTKAAWIGFAYAAAFQLQIELWDATQAQYGFSVPDVLFNTAGQALALGRELSPRLRVVKPTISYYPSAPLRKFGQGGDPGGQLRSTIDYSGQTYWLSFDVDSLLPPERREWWPGIVRLSVGHTITDWIRLADGYPTRARRRVVIGLDLDVSKLPGDHPVWRRVKEELSYIRLPGPAIVIGPGVSATALFR